jgi:hypothetical protein
MTIEQFNSKPQKWKDTHCIEITSIYYGRKEKVWPTKDCPICNKIKPAKHPICHKKIK